MHGAVWVVLWWRCQQSRHENNKPFKLSLILFYFSLHFCARNEIECDERWFDANFQIFTKVLIKWNDVYTVRIMKTQYKTHTHTKSSYILALHYYYEAFKHIQFAFHMARYGIFMNLILSQSECACVCGERMRISVCIFDFMKILRSKNQIFNIA